MVIMYTKNINHDYHNHHHHHQHQEQQQQHPAHQSVPTSEWNMPQATMEVQAQPYQHHHHHHHHHPDCASLRQAVVEETSRECHHQSQSSITTVESSGMVKLNSFLNYQANGSCHNHSSGELHTSEQSSPACGQQQLDESLYFPTNSRTLLNMSKMISGETEKTSYSMETTKGHEANPTMCHFDHDNIAQPQASLSGFLRAPGSLKSEHASNIQDCGESGQQCSPSSLSSSSTGKHHQRVLLCGPSQHSEDHQHHHHPPPHSASQSLHASNEARKAKSETLLSGTVSFSVASLPRQQQRRCSASSTLPTNTTLSALLQTSTSKMNDAQAAHHHQQSQATLRYQQHHQSMLRRQASLSQLDSIDGKQQQSGAGTLNKSEPKFAIFQQRIKALLSSKSESSSPSPSNTTVNNHNTLTRVLSTRETTPVEQALTTLNKYTISRSSHNLSNSRLSNHRLNDIDEIEDDTFKLRDVCNKLYASTKHQAPYGTIATNPAPSSRNLTAENAINKIVAKESLYSCHAQAQQLSLSTPQATGKNLQQKLEEENIVVVSELSPSHGLTVRTNQQKSVKLTSFAHPSAQSSPQSRQHLQQGSSNLSLNAVEPTESSVASQDHNYKSSSESGRGTINSQTGDHNNIDMLNSPADLTSLDSDQSNRIETNGWKESQTRQQAMKASFNPRMQRYLDEQRCSGQDSELTLCKEFTTNLNIDENDSESWTSVSDDQSNGKQQTQFNGKTSKLKAKQTTVTKTLPMRANRIDAKLKTNFSKPENCIAPNAKLAPTATIQSKPQKIQANGGNKAGPGAGQPTTSMDKIVANGMAGHDKCIYSVPNKGKYRELLANGNAGAGGGGGAAAAAASMFVNSQFDKANDNDSESSDPESNFPDDGCSEITDFYNNHHHHGRDPLHKQLQGIEEMYAELLSMLNSKNERPKRKLFRRNSGRSSVASRNARDHIYRKYRSNDYRRSRPEDSGQMSRRYKKLESQVLTLAKSVSQLSADIQVNYMLSEEMNNLRHDIDTMKTTMSSMKQCVLHMSKTSSHQTSQANLHAPPTQAPSTSTKKDTKPTKKVDKLKRLFIDEPQPMKQFLKKLGYEKYAKIFDCEKIGLVELTHLNEDRLHKLGIPLGPRIRILQEAKALGSLLSSSEKAQHGNKCGTLPVDSYNIYAVV